MTAPATSSLLDFFDRDVTLVARELLGAELRVGGVGGIIVETEAYHPTDPASHSFRGPTPRTATMFGPPARVYVYRSYGIHWCMNFVCEAASAVLIRAVEPRFGLAEIAARRGTADPLRLAAGPGNVCAALGISGVHDGLPLGAPPFALTLATARPAVVVGPRIGISKAIDKPWRFGVADSPYLSRRFPRPAP